MACNFCRESASKAGTRPSEQCVALKPFGLHQSQGPHSDRQQRAVKSSSGRPKEDIILLVTTLQAQPPKATLRICGVQARLDGTAWPDSDAPAATLGNWAGVPAAQTGAEHSVTGAASTVYTLNRAARTGGRLHRYDPTGECVAHST